MTEPWRLQLHWNGPRALRLVPGSLQTTLSAPRSTPEFERTTLSIPSGGDTLDAWLYLPKQQEKKQAALPPLVVLGHGMGAQKDMGLDVYASAFAAGGLACLVFDYRSFGGSTGEPRQWTSPTRHVQDWRAVIAWAQQHLAGRVNESRLCLWGSSFGGGHALVVAADTPGVTAVVSQVPHLDARAATLLSIKKRGVAKSLACLCLGVLDRLRTAAGLAPLYLPLVGPPGSLAFMQLSDFETREYFSKHPAVYQGGWQNLTRACLALELFARRYSPLASVASIPCPVLFVAASQDELCPVDQVHRAVRLARRGRLCSRECTHFELYRGELFEGLVAEQLAFLQQATGLKQA